MNKKLTLGELDRLLEKLGFVHRESNGSHKLYRHSASKAMFVLPAISKGEIPVRYLTILKRLTIEQGIVDEKKFEEFLQNTIK